MNTESQLVTSHLDAIESIHSSISSEKTISRGYSQVRAITKTGVSYVSGENKPKTTKATRESFVDVITSFIANILVK